MLTYTYSSQVDLQIARLHNTKLQMGKKTTTAIKRPAQKTTHPKNNNLIQHKIQQLQLALSEVLDQNQTLRHRVIELQALLVAAQMELEDREQRKDTRDEACNRRAEKQVKVAKW